MLYLDYLTFTNVETIGDADGWIATFNESEDGRYLIILNGLSRFKILDEIKMFGFRIIP